MVRKLKKNEAHSKEEDGATKDEASPDVIRVKSVRAKDEKLSTDALIANRSKGIKKASRKDAKKEKKEKLKKERRVRKKAAAEFLDDQAEDGSDEEEI